MVISLREDYFKGGYVSWQEIKDLRLLQGKNNLEISGKQSNQTSPSLQEVSTFSQLITKLRHAFAHNCFELIVDGSNKITGIKVWNVPLGQDNKPKNRVWEAEITEDQLKDLANLVVKYIEKELG